MAKGKNNKPVTKKVKSNNQRDQKQLLPLNERQREYIQAINTSPVIICTGVLGSSKTYIPSVIASDWLISKKIEKIIVARPAEGAGKSMGYNKGSLYEKASVWCAPILDTMKKRMGQGHFEAFIENGRVELLPLEAVKGRSWDDTFIIVDEAEDLDPVVAKSLVTRQGQGSTTVITGDIAQKDIKKHSGLEMLLFVAKKYNLPFAHIDFNSWDYCVRSEEAKLWGMAFEQYEREKNQ